MYVRMLKARNSFIPYNSELESKLDQELIIYRPSFEGEWRSSNYFKELLRRETDRERRKRAWYSYTSVGHITAPGLVTLVKERNNIARECGADNYYEFQLSSTGMNVEVLFALFAEIDSASREPYRLIIQRKQFDLGIDTIEPWDISYSSDRGLFEFDSFFKKDSVMALLNETLTGLGYPAQDLKIIYDMESRYYKNQGAFCMPVHIPDDIRVLVNMADGYASCSDFFHEVGHALHFSYIDQPYYILRASPSECFSEAMAAINENMLRWPEWLSKYAGIPDSLVKAAVFHLKDSEIISLRYDLAHVCFERELYRTDAERPTELYWDIMSRFTLCGQHLDSDSWASIHHFTNNPVYLQNYILGNLIAAQTLSYLERTNGSVIGNKKTAEFLIDNYFKPGASKDWSDLVQDATEEPLNARYYIEDLLSR